MAKATKSKIDVAIMISVLVTIMGCTFGYGVLNAKVEAHETRLGKMMPRNEIEKVTQYEEKRFDRLEDKVDLLLERKH